MTRSRAGMPRPNLKHEVAARITPRLRRRLEQLADLRETTLSEILRDACREYADRHLPSLDPPENPKTSKES